MKKQVCLCTIVKGDNTVFRIINWGFDLAQAIENRFHEISASYYQWEILKEWRLK